MERQTNKIGWQIGKSVAECNEYMLENAIGTDVCFDVGPPGEPSVEVLAHKYVLVSRSPVFEAMFSGRFTEHSSVVNSQKIRIIDFEADVFWETLR